MKKIIKPTPNEQLEFLKDEIDSLWNQLNRNEISETRAIFDLTLFLSKTISYLIEIKNKRTK